MGAYIARRVIQSLIVILIVTLIVFLGMRLLPGDPILMFVSADASSEMSEAQITELRHEFGLDRPMLVQYYNWAKDTLHGDLGVSMVTRTNVSSLISRSIPITFHLSGLSLILSVIIGIPLGIIAAVRRGTWMDTVATLIANFGITVPAFWLGILLIYLFGLELGWLPLFGYTSPFEDFWLNTQQIIMPVFCIAIFGIASIARQTRSSLLEVIHLDYIRTAWSKGLTEQAIIIKHALKNALMPVVTLLGVTVRNLVGGSVIIETVFNIPGMGRTAVNGLQSQDYAVVQGVVLITALAVIVANFIVDLSYGWLDPRIRLS